MKPLYAIFGGTFDPFHYGHLLSCVFLSYEIKIKKVIIVPNNIPPHRQLPKTSLLNKLEMIKLSVFKNTLFQINTIECENNQISYTIKTIQKIKNTLDNTVSLGLIIGEDNIKNFYTWHDWTNFLKFCHIIVCPRKNKNIILKNNILNTWIQNYQIIDYRLLHKYSFGCIFFANTPVINISSTQIRNRCKNNKDISTLVHWQVEKYIKNNNLYKK